MRQEAGKASASAQPDTLGKQRKTLNLSAELLLAVMYPCTSACLTERDMAFNELRAEIADISPIWHLL
ncbi:hypothetical protein AB1N83_011967 [Pleurotus pulmonarius]